MAGHGFFLYVDWEAIWSRHMKSVADMQVMKKEAEMQIARDRLDLCAECRGAAIDVDDTVETEVQRRLAMCLECRGRSIDEN